MTRVAIIGAGLSGLAAIKSCIEEELQPVCYEQHDNIGGIWYYTEDIRPNQGASSYETLVTNTSKEFSCYSDFPFPPDAPTYLNKQQFFDYLNDYADNFNLKKHIQLNKTVTKVEKSVDHDVTGNWLISYRKTSDNTSTVIQTEVFNKVMVCSGRYKKPIFPTIPGLENFKGVLQHAIEFRTAKDEIYKDKNLLIIGNSHSAADVAAACTEHAKQVTLAIGRGTWLLSRYQGNGLPTELIMMRRAILRIMPTAVINFLMKKVCNIHIDHGKYGLSSEVKPLYGPLCINESLPSLIKSGLVTVKRKTLQVQDDSTVVFDDGEQDKFDVIITSTGYDVEYKFLDTEIYTDGEGDLKLYYLVWPIGTTSRQSLAIIGGHNNRGSAVPGIELETRWAARVFSDKLQLPATSVMENENRRRTCNVIRMFGAPKTISDKSILDFQDEIADQVGVKPSFWKLLLRGEIVLAYQVYFGPAFSVQYRLLGPHAWSGSKLASKSAYRNTERGLGLQESTLKLRTVILGVFFISTATLAFIYFTT